MARVRVQQPAPPAVGAEAVAAREAEIARVQNEALERTRAAAAPPPDSERAAIQAEAAGSPPAAVSSALSAGFFGAGATPFQPPAAAPAPAPPPAPGEDRTAAGGGLVPGFMLSHPYAPADLGDEITVTLGTQLYGKPGTFSTYEVGPFSTKDRVRPGETRAQAFLRVLKELREVANAEREVAHADFCNHFMTKIVGQK